MCQKNVLLFLRQFSELLYFCVGFLQFTDAFLGRFYQYLHIFCSILCVFHQNVKQCFGDKILDILSVSDIAVF